MHAPDGFLDVPTSIATGAVAVGVVGLALQRSRRELDESGTPLAGLVAVFIFAVQMVNFPVGAGTSGHLLGGALAAVLVGPWTAVLCMSVVLLVQGLVFADGGLTALGTNITVMGIVTAVVGYAVVRALLAVLPKRPGSVVPAATIGALLSVPAAAVAFTALYAVGGSVEIPIGSLAAAMIGWHVLIGIGEALITGAVVGAVVATRPDLVHAARHLRPDLVLVGADGVETTVQPDHLPVARSTTRPLAVGAAVSLVVAGVVSLIASGHPDGLEFVGGQQGFLESATDSAVSGSPFAGYGLRGVDAVAATGVAGVVGVVVVALLAALVLGVSRRFGRRAGSDTAERAGSSSTPVS